MSSDETAITLADAMKLLQSETEPSKYVFELHTIHQDQNCSMIIIKEYTKFT